ncbi:MAG TPA: potassium transporter Kup [Candidatus Limnocylindrales bacterium]|jgi:KUP system potassium uptake protein|nr:potassium transporter Kup [Candidatus Limnocylindrales bacterium]
MNGTPIPDSAGGRASSGARPAMLLAALGVVYGDIGTSPLYAFRESLKSAGGSVAATEAAVLGILSLIVWTLVIVVTLKYVLFVMRADNQGEGGIMALLALALPEVSEKGTRKFLLVVGVGGAALLYGDGMITPAISVLSAVEGLSFATTFFEPYIVPITLVILIALFAVQSYGSGPIGRLFGPIMAIWFLTLGLAGFWHILAQPSVLAALNPAHAISFLGGNGWTAVIVLGSVFLVVTGAEALYADMGHFGRRVIRVDWFILVLPALALNYFGQGALVLANPQAAANPFFLMFPSWLLYPIVVLATAATVIASQALISGAFTLSQQATLLGLLPRLEIRQTSSSAIGQVYVPQINWLLAGSVVALVLGFRTSGALANAYGIAVVSTMIATTVLAGVVAHHRWGWSLPLVLTVTGAFLIIDLIFLVANAPKIPHGGWFPLIAGALIFTIMMTWRRGRKVVLERLEEDQAKLSEFFEKLDDRQLPRVKGTAVYLSARRDTVPSALALNLRHNKVLHDRVLLLNVEVLRVPFVTEKSRVVIEALPKGFLGVTVRFGFYEKLDVLDALNRHTKAARGDGSFTFELAETTFFLGREVPVPTVRPDLSGWQTAIYTFLTRNAVSAPEYYLIPTENVVELGTRVEI